MPDRKGGKKLKSAVLGMRAHSGWAAAVVVAGAPAKPEILERQRVELLQPESNHMHALQPYHLAEMLPFAKAEALITRLRDNAQALADAALDDLQKETRAKGYAIIGCGILGSSGKPLGSLADILASHAKIHTADGEFFREAIAAACGRLRIPAIKIPEREVAAQATPAQTKQIAALGKALGPPWTADQKLSAMIAFNLLAKGKLQLAGRVLAI